MCPAPHVNAMLFGGLEQQTQRQAFLHNDVAAGLS